MAKTAQLTQREEELVRRFRQGDDAAFDRLVDLCTPRVYNLAYRMLGHAEDAQDLTQEVFIRVYHALARFKGESAFTTWLYRIVINVCQDELKRRRRRPLNLSEMARDDEEALTFADTATTGETAEDAVLQQERRQRLHEAITALPENYRVVVVLFDLQGFSYQEIADILHTNVGTVKSRLNRARNTLREQLSPARELFGLKDSRIEQ